jgi:integrase
MEGATMPKSISCGPYVPYRDGRPRFNPGPRERDLGFAGRDLKHASGAWFSFEEARAWAIDNALIIAARRAGGDKPKAPTPKGRTLEDLLIDWHASDAVQSLEQTTIDGYDRQIDSIIYKPQSRGDRKAHKPKERETFARAPLGAIGKPEVVAFIEYQKKARGHHMALASRAVISAAFTWGETSTRWRLTANPAARLRLKRPKGRVVIYTMPEIRALLAAADALARPSVGDAILLGLFTGQRQGDRLDLADAGLSDGRRQLKQNKTGAIVAIPETPELRTRLEAASARVAAITLRLGLKAKPATIIVDEATGRPYNEHTYRHVFADVRALAIKGSNEYGLPPCASLTWIEAGAPKMKRDQDLRDTAVTWLARAGATVPEIASITGHSLASIYAIMKHYLAITPELADAGIAKLVAWMTKEGMAV